MLIIHIILTKNEHKSYVQDRHALTHTSIIEKAKAIMTPYTLECPEIEWWSVYVIGQRLCKQVSLCDRVFIAGYVPSHCFQMILTAVIRRDAFHTHSPKAGRMMSVYRYFSFADSPDVRTRSGYECVC